MNTTTIRITCRCGTTCEITSNANGGNRYIQDFLDAHDDCDPKPPRNEYHTHVTEEVVVVQEYSVGEKLTIRMPGHPPQVYTITDVQPTEALGHPGENEYEVVGATLTIQREMPMPRKTTGVNTDAN